MTKIIHAGGQRWTSHDKRQSPHHGSRSGIDGLRLRQASDARGLYQGIQVYRVDHGKRERGQVGTELVS